MTVLPEEEPKGYEGLFYVESLLVADLDREIAEAKQLVRELQVRRGKILTRARVRAHRLENGRSPLKTEGFPAGLSSR